MDLFVVVLFGFVVFVGDEYYVVGVCLGNCVLDCVLLVCDFDDLGIIVDFGCFS